jgi:hypothetical protein
VEEGSSSGGRISTPTRPRAVALAGVCAVSSALALAASSRKVAAALLSHSESMSGAQHGAQPPPPKGPPPSAVSQAEDTISVALVGASPVVLDGTYMGSMNVLRCAETASSPRKSSSPRRRVLRNRPARGRCSQPRQRTAHVTPSLLGLIADRERVDGCGRAPHLPQPEGADQ